MPIADPLKRIPPAGRIREVLDFHRQQAEKLGFLLRVAEGLDAAQAGSMSVEA